MRAQGILEDANYLDARYLAEHMRNEDRAEVLATSETGDVLAAVLLCMKRSEFCYSFKVGGELVCMGGVIPYGPRGVGMGWLLSAKGTENNWREFARQSKKLLPALLQGYSLIYNYVDVRYIKSICWLLWLGFEDGKVYYMAPSKLPFVKMSLRVGG